VEILSKDRERVSTMTREIPQLVVKVSRGAMAFEVLSIPKS